MPERSRKFYIRSPSLKEHQNEDEDDDEDRDDDEDKDDDTADGHIMSGKNSDDPLSRAAFPGSPYNCYCARLGDTIDKLTEPCVTHQPNVVSFYGIVRDGPVGSLATVTEFMVNGSLKQFLQGKDRTIDQRKRLSIAMDAAFGMAYLHEKIIVHFDLKFEHCLVYMRDVQRPWMAPEFLSGKSNMITEKIDVYSFGVVMWELLTGDESYVVMHCAATIGVSNFKWSKSIEWRSKKASEEATLVVADPNSSFILRTRCVLGEGIDTCLPDFGGYCWEISGGLSGLFEIGI